jgi:signal transduction histidine kinase
MPRAVPTTLNKIFIDHTIAVVAVATAFGLTVFLWNFIEPEAAPLFLAAVAIAAWRGGIYPSLLASALSALALDYFFNPPLNAFELSAKNAVGTSVFLVAALLISYIDRARKLALTERERLLRSERKALAEAEEASRAKDVFLAMVTHELRSPLNAVLGWTQILKKKTLDAAQTGRALDVIERSTRTQAQLVEDLLDISRIKTGNFRINAAPIELCAVIDSAIESVAPAIAAKRIRLERDLDERIGLINCDAERLRQVVWNLLSNAVKFAREGGRIDICLTRAGNYARLMVYDDGAGIRQDFLPFVFDSFRQADESDKGKHKGLGLGLTIVRHLVEAHGGTITAASAGAGLGAAFTIELPLLADVRQAQETEIKKDTNLEYV